MILKIILVLLLFAVVIIGVYAIYLFVKETKEYDPTKLDEILDAKYPPYPDATFYLGDKRPKKKIVIKKTTKKL